MQCMGFCRPYSLKGFIHLARARARALLIVWRPDYLTTWYNTNIHIGTALESQQSASFNRGLSLSSPLSALSGCQHSIKGGSLAGRSQSGREEANILQWLALHHSGTPSWTSSCCAVIASADSLWLWQCRDCTVVSWLPGQCKPWSGIEVKELSIPAS